MVFVFENVSFKEANICENYDENLSFAVLVENFINQSRSLKRSCKLMKLIEENPEVKMMKKIIIVKSSDESIRTVKKVLRKLN